MLTGEVREDQGVGDEAGGRVDLVAGVVETGLVLSRRRLESRAVLVGVPLHQHMAHRNIGVGEVGEVGEDAVGVVVDPGVRPDVPVRVAAHVAEREGDVLEVVVAVLVGLPRLLPQIAQPLVGLGTVRGLVGTFIVVGAGIRMDVALTEEQIGEGVRAHRSRPVGGRELSQRVRDRLVDRDGDRGRAVDGVDRDRAVLDDVLQRILDAEQMRRRLPGVGASGLRKRHQKTGEHGRHGQDRDGPLHRAPPG